MSTVVQLREWTRSEPMTLSESSWRLLADLDHLIEMKPAVRGRWTLKPKGVVGRIQLPECTLDLTPKYPIANLCRMIAAVAGIPELFEFTTVLSEGGLADLLVAAFVQRAEALLTAGLRRDYMEQHERLAVLRGRLDLPVHLRRPEALRTDLDCRHEEYSLDTPFNAVLRQTAEACYTRWSPLAGRILRLRHRLASLPRATLRPAEIERFRYDRLTESYRPLHALCRLILEGTSLGLGDRQATGASFVIKMWPLFERFVSLSLRERLKPPWRVESQEQVALDRVGAIQIRPDVVVYDRDRPVVVLDAKYTLRDSAAPAPSNAFQVLAYARRYGVRRGWLVYPDRPEGERVFVSHDGHNEIASFGLDLSANWEIVRARLDRLAELMRGAERGTSTRSCG